jgi:hypothetical protein
MSDPRYTDPRSTDPRLNDPADPRFSDPVVRREQNSGSMWGWVAGIAVLALIGFIMVAGWNSGPNTTASTNPPQCHAAGEHDRFRRDLAAARCSGAAARHARACPGQVTDWRLRIKMEAPALICAGAEGRFNAAAIRGLRKSRSRAWCSPPLRAPGIECR